MKFIGDFHIHSKYSRAVSAFMDLETLDKWAQIKGIQVMGTGDFTHPAWISEIKDKLEEAEPGFFKLKNAALSLTHNATRFVLTSEISCIYKKNGKVRKNHLIVFAPSIKAVETINARLSTIGNLLSDGRPILGLDAKELVKIALEADEDCLIVPAHAWTPWFSVFGSKSGFDSLEECFDTFTKYIYAIETGLSSDPTMNWRISALDNIALLSNSDSHSPQKIGREANVFNVDFSYYGILDAIKTRDKQKFLYTIEFFPEEGKYHFDGHALCHVSLSPQQSKKANNMCPVCNKPLVIGVLHRVEALADRPDGFVPEHAIPFKSIIPLAELISQAVSTGVSSKRVATHYNSLIKNIGSEFTILLDSPYKLIEKHSLPEIAEAVAKMRKKEVTIEPGYDGIYGKIAIFNEKLRKDQKSLFN